MENEDNKKSKMIFHKMNMEMLVKLLLDLIMKLLIQALTQFLEKEILVIILIILAIIFVQKILPQKIQYLKLLNLKKKIITSKTILAMYFMIQILMEVYFQKHKNQLIMMIDFL